MNKSWTGLGIGNKNKKGEYLDMYFHPDNIYDSEKIIEKVKNHEPNVGRSYCCKKFMSL